MTARTRTTARLPPTADPYDRPADAGAAHHRPPTCARRRAGLAVLLVLVFHQARLSGGYFGVSVFFTLSATSSHRWPSPSTTTPAGSTSEPSRPAVRRLLPASLVCILGIGRWRGPACSTRSSTSAVTCWAALTQLSNWSPWVAAARPDRWHRRFGAVAAGPLLVVGDRGAVLLGVAACRWSCPAPSAARPVRLVAALTVLAALAAPLIAMTFGPDAAYWATPARLGEILVGALLAVVLHARRARVRCPRPSGCWRRRDSPWCCGLR